MKKIMFVCSGNICRSAMAHGLMDKLAKEYGKEIEVYSCGTSAYTGDNATYSAIEASKEYDVDISEHRATNILESDIKNMDLILCATENHKRYVLQMYPELKSNIYTIKEFANPESEDKDIKDPWGYDMEIYRHCCKEIYECVKKIIEKI